MNPPSTETAADRAAAALPFDHFFRLVRQAHLEGASYETLRLVVEAAAHHGAARALRQCGLEDGAAGRDINDLRQLLDAWRDVKRTARNAVVRWAICAALALMIMGTALKLRQLDLP